ncbi:MAG TPA: hypothetical protein VMG09_07675 [Bacteroidota bacterium]|nr:hypothetical protein [Bacteroidota bacterium]
MRFFLLLAVAAILSPPVSAQIDCSGVVTGPGGKPLPMAHVALLTPDATSVLQVNQATTTGAFRVTLPGSGLWFLRFTGVGYSDYSMVVYAQDRRPIELTIALGCHNYFAGQPDISVIGDFNLWNILSAVPMKYQGHGLYTAEVHTKSDTVTFRLRGIRDRDVAEGVRNATYVRTPDGLYNARIPASGGKAIIRFEESLLDRSGTPAKAVFVAATDRTKRIASAVSRWWKGEQDYIAARLNAARSRKPLDSTIFDWRPRLAALFREEEKEPDTLVRSVLALAYVSTALKARDRDVASATTCLEHLGPGSQAWELNPDALSLSVRKSSWPEAKWEAYIHEALARQPSRSVKEAVLFNEFQIALLSEEKEKAAGYYDILTTQYADTPRGKMIREKYSRPGTPPAGKK